VVGADGRNSVVRDYSGLPIEDLGAPTDVLWMRLSRHADDPEVFFYADRGKALFLIGRGDYWQCGAPAPKGAIAEMQAKGIEEFRTAIVELAPFLQDRVGELRDWTDLRLLTVRVNRLRQWDPFARALSAPRSCEDPAPSCVPHAAYAAGAGIDPETNLRAWPRQSGPTRLPWLLRLMERTTLPCRLRNRVIAVGIRPEHVRTPDASLAQAGPATHNPKCERSNAG
jgi:hypothetical protein